MLWVSKGSNRFGLFKDSNRFAHGSEWKLLVMVLSGALSVLVGSGKLLVTGVSGEFSVVL